MEPSSSPINSQIKQTGDGTQIESKKADNAKTTQQSGPTLFNKFVTPEHSKPTPLKKRNISPMKEQQTIGQVANKLFSRSQPNTNDKSSS